MEITTLPSTELTAYRTQMAELFLAAFQEKFNQFNFNEADSQVAAQGMIDYFIDFHNDTLLVALEDETLLGCTLVSIAPIDGRRLMRYLRQKMPLRLWARLFFFLKLVKHSLAEREAYIEFIAVSPVARGLGIGTLLLKAAVNRFIPDYRLTLTVAAKNEGAHKLYVRKGFRDIHVWSSQLMQRWIGIREWVEMEWWGERLK